MAQVTYENQLPVYDLVLGPFDPTDMNTSYLNAVNHVLGTGMTFDELRSTQDTLIDTIDTNGLASLPVEMQELWATFNGVKQILKGDFPQTIQADNLTNWPIFQGIMNEPENHASKTSGAALMIGSASVLSSVAFGHLAQEVYGTDRTIIVDKVSGVGKGHAGNFIRADGLKLPFDARSISLVHTDRLLGSLSDDARTFDEFPESVFALIKEIARVLPVGGQVFMNEALPGITEGASRKDLAYSLEFLATLLRNSFNNNGMRCVTDQAWLPTDSTFWHDPHRHLDIKNMQPISSVAVYAQKVELQPDAQFAWAE